MYNLLKNWNEKRVSMPTSLNTMGVASSSGLLTRVEEERMDFMPHYFKEYMTYEQTMFGMMSQKSSSYTGGFWEFYHVENLKAPLMILGSTEKKATISTCYEELDTDEVTVSLAVNLLTLNHLSFYFYDKGMEKEGDNCNNYYHTIYNKLDEICTELGADIKVIYEVLD